jgi:hypothetical protein
MTGGDRSQAIRRIKADLQNCDGSPGCRRSAVIVKPEAHPCTIIND